MSWKTSGGTENAELFSTGKVRLPIHFIEPNLSLAILSSNFMIVTIVFNFCCWFSAGYPESAVQLLKKSAKILEMKYPNEALGLYLKAAETVGCEDRPKEASEYMARVAQLQVFDPFHIHTFILICYIC